MKYIYRAAEVQLGQVPVYMREAVVENLDLVTFRAHVTITFCDYSERGILGTDPWFAVSRDLGQTWVVQRAEPPAGGFVFRAGDDSSSEPLFTLQEGVNQDIKEFVARKLAMLAYASGADHVVEEAVVPYTGSMFEYTGPCVCEKIRDSSDIHPFDWKGHTGGGRYPDRCFACSCGARWYLGDPDNSDWVPVVDQPTWDMLLRYNGVSYRAWTFDPRYQENPPRLILLESIVLAGLTPL